MKQNLKYLLTIHTAALVVFTLFRLVLFASTDYTFLEEIQHDWMLQAEAFVRGIWFDNVIACYITILPLVVLWVASMFRYHARWIYRFVTGWFIAFYTVAFAVCAANIPYFGYFFKVINSSIYNWFGYAGTTAGMIFGETSYYFPIALGVTAIIAWAGFIIRMTKRTLNSIQENEKRKENHQLSTINYQLIKTAVTGAVLIGLCLFGIRGRTGYNPIKVSQAYYCEDPFLNQLGVTLYSTCSPPLWTTCARKTASWN